MPILKGEKIAIYYNLTNISGQPQTVHVVGPLVNPILYSANGSVVWAWDPPEINSIMIFPFPSGDLTGQVFVPTSNLDTGANYTLSIWPLIGANSTNAVDVGDYSIGESLTINASISIAITFV
jgi:hypothetical protein